MCGVVMSAVTDEHNIAADQNKLDDEMTACLVVLLVATLSFALSEAVLTRSQRSAMVR